MREISPVTLTGRSRGNLFFVKNRCDDPYDNRLSEVGSPERFARRWVGVRVKEVVVCRSYPYLYAPTDSGSDLRRSKTEKD